MTTTRQTRGLARVAMLIAGIALASASYSARDAGAAETVTRFGSTLAQACFHASYAHQPSRSGLADCDAALTEELLSRSDRAATLVNRGILRVLQNDKEGALADYAASIALDPNLGDAYINRGMVYVRESGKETLAIEEINKGLRIGSRDESVALFGRALAHEALGRISDAYHDYKRAAELKPQWTAPQIELARFTIRRNVPQAE